MLIQVTDGRRTSELEMQVNHPAASVADLAAALRVDPDAPLVVGGRLVDPDLGLDECGLHDGVVVHVGGRPDDAASPAWWLEVVGGLEAGRRAALPPGSHVVGRGAGVTLALRSETVSARHLEIDVEGDGPPVVTDLDSRNGTWLGDQPVMDPTPVEGHEVLKVGAVQLAVRPGRSGDRPNGVDPLRDANSAGVLPFNRPPRAALAQPAPSLEPPEPPAKQGARTPMMVVSAIAPLIMAAVIVQITGEIRFALFALMSPVMIIGGTIERRRRQTTSARKDRKRYAMEMAAFEVELAQMAERERRRLDQRVPDPAEVIRRADLPSTHLWERRPEHDDLLELRLGVGTAPWPAPVRQKAGSSPTPELAELLERWTLLPDAPLVADLRDGGIVGLAGDRDAALAVARSLLVQATVHHGPADLPVLVLASPETAGEWDWAKWLPHTRDASTGARWLAGEREAAELLVNAFIRSGSSGPDDGGPTVFAVVDDESLIQGRRAPTRTLLRGSGGRVAGIVIAPTVDRLPAMCTWVADLRGPDGVAVVRRPADGLEITDVLATGIDEPTARSAARALARFEDPELAVVGAGLPDRTRLLPLLGLDEVTPTSILEHWIELGPDPRAAGAIGVDEDDVFEIDLDRDGPHGLVAGTTGAGKSELLRTLVASMAVASSPQALTFVLVDFKGGSAFDACAQLPHTVGLVTDLDELLAERALKSLEAELHHRERLLRAVEASDLVEYRKKGSPSGPLPRLLVVVDEFATLKAELPEFVESLVGIAQRGRSLGVHMILATQRPSGAISENIRANTNLRIALRVQDSGDSNDVLGVPDAANIPRGRPGRAYVRLGPNEVVAIQTALSTAGDAAGAVAPVELVPFRFGPRVASVRPDGDSSATDLEVLVEAAAEAFERSGWPAPRRPWPEPLPAVVPLDELIDAGTEGPDDAAGDTVVLALADDPGAQAQYPVGWRPSEGNLAFIGIPGSGTTTALASLALSMARTRTADDLHLYVLDMGAGDLLPLAGLPHCGAVVVAAERERQLRLVRHLRTELDARRQLSAAERRALPRIVFLLDGYASLAAEFKDGIGNTVLDDIERIVADGPEVAISAVLTGDRPGAVPSRLLSVVRRKYLFRLADVGDYGMAGMRLRQMPSMPAGRAFDADGAQLVQVGFAGDLDAAVARLADASAPPTRPPAPVAELPSHLALAEVIGGVELSSRPWSIPIGVAERDLSTVAFTVYEGEHVFVGGTARSGRTTTLAAIGRVVRHAAPAATIVAVASPRSDLSQLVDAALTVAPDDLAEALDAVAAADPGAPTVLLIDDAELVDDTSDGRLAALIGRSASNLLIAAAGRPDVLRGMFSHWSRALRRAKLGALLSPDLDLDGDILGVTLPRRLPVPVGLPGRGFVVNAGRAELAQLADIDRHLPG